MMVNHAKKIKCDPVLGTSELIQTKFLKKKNWIFFLQFHVISMPVCSVFDAFWYVWYKYFILACVGKAPTGLFSNFSLWENCSKGLEYAKNREIPLIFALKIHGRVIFTTYKVHFFPKATFYSHFGAVFGTFILKIMPSNSRYLLTRYTRVLWAKKTGKKIWTIFGL